MASEGKSAGGSSGGRGGAGGGPGGLSLGLSLEIPEEVVTKMAWEDVSSHAACARAAAPLPRCGRAT